MTYETTAQAAGECEPWLVRIVSVEGEVEARRMGRPAWSSVHLDEVFCTGDSLRVKQHSRAVILLHHEQTTLNLDQGTTLTFTEEEQEATWLDMLKGAIHFISRTPHTLKVKTPYVNAAVEGTEFLVRIEPARTLLWIFEGRVLTSNQAGNLMLASNQGAIVKAGEAPRSYVLVNPRIAVQWALYYPPVIDYGDKKQTTVSSSGIRQALQQYRRGNMAQALTSLDSVPAAQRDTRYYTLRAYLLLNVGRVDEALPALRQALDRDPRNGIAVALQAIIALVQNDKDTALTLARRAVEFSPQVAVPYIASSYVQQAAFDIDGALASAEQAVRLSPDDALAWTRVAELRLANGDLEESLSAAQQAVSLNPELARTQTVLGFAHLIRLETRQAEAAFNRAVQLNSADPLPRLGQGLVLIRQGKLKAGRQLLEIATSLDPNRSLIRSYLGKAYYEEKRNELAGTELALAKELDPQDPTPWFYDAIREQTQNRPVEALQDIQKSIELNDNRAVHRSRLLLDQDSAARGASLGRIYDELGFEQLALKEGWQSTITDPSNFSAHRLLADSYSRLPRHEIGRVSELLQSQLLQPLNLTPLQPQLAESNLGIISGTGPSDLALNEYSSLFIREGWRLQANGVIGGNQTRGNDLVLSGLTGKFGYSLGQFHYETDGFRPNNDQKINIYSAFVQAEPTYNTSIQAEFRASDLDQGDLTRRLDPDDLDPSERERIESRLARLGFRYKHSPSIDFLASLTYENRDFHSTFSIANPLLEVTLDSEREGSNLELQQLFRSQRMNLITGGGYIAQDFDRNVTTVAGGTSFSSINRDEIKHGIIYAYPYIKFKPELTLVLGASGDFPHGLPRNKDQFNPKLGLLWRPWPNTLLRAAAFRALARTFIGNQQTLEPTHVAGFNQFYNDSQATEIWRYGLAIDQKISPAHYAGLEFSQRDLTVPVRFIPGPGMPPQVTSADWKEQLGRAYFHWLPAPQLAISNEYIFERFQRDPDFPSPSGFLDLRTHHLRWGAYFFFHSGFSSSLIANYVDQNFEAFGGPDLGDRFWIIDTTLSYRLPKRFGEISLEVQNLLDSDFNYEVTDNATPLFYPARLMLMKLTLAF